MMIRHGFRTMFSCKYHGQSHGLSRGKSNRETAHFGRDNTGNIRHLSLTKGLSQGLSHFRRQTGIYLVIDKTVNTD